MCPDERIDGTQEQPVDWWDLEEVLTYFVHNAALILDECGAELNGLQVKSESVSELTDPDRARAHAPSQIISRANAVLFWVEKNDCKNAALNMMQLTRAAVELMPMKVLAASAQKSRQGLDVGRAKLQSDREKKSELCRELAQEVRDRDSSLSAWSVALHTSQRLARQYEIELGQRQVYNYIRGLWQSE